MPDQINQSDNEPREGLAAVVDAGAALAKPDILDPTTLYGVTVPAGASHHVIDLERYAETPYRKKGTRKPATLDSLIAYVKLHDDGEASTLWVHPTVGKVVAILDDHDQETPGWAEHRAVLDLLHTPEWTHWLSRDNRLVDQVEFAQHIEDGLNEIVTPDAADMLEIAQTFHATTSAQFRTANRLQDGQVQLRYEEEINATAGQAGETKIPSEFILVLAPFIGEPRVQLTARLRYRLTGGNLRIGYKLDRPHELIRGTLDDIKRRLDSEFGRVYLGQPS